ncbi:hypothetical protein BD311DRAFT_407185 [Dichomitus squalens]|uniref:Uncharacterized protein n=1 Tax=Dichomitus squalens TaxID=114155 RepID=A0A4V2K001_9APHY|nr:hypothetical protein BD311DRAFT_407185 [Dichomitus squalens]
MEATEANLAALTPATPLAPSPALQIHSLVSRTHDDPREAQPDTTHIHSVIAYRVRTSNANVDRTCKLSLPLPRQTASVTPFVSVSLPWIPPWNISTSYGLTPILSFRLPCDRAIGCEMTMYGLCT